MTEPLFSWCGETYTLCILFDRVLRTAKKSVFADITFRRNMLVDSGAAHVITHEPQDCPLCRACALKKLKESVYGVFLSG